MIGAKPLKPVKAAFERLAKVAGPSNRLTASTSRDFGIELGQIQLGQAILMVNDATALADIPPHPIVGMTNALAPSPTPPSGHFAVTVFTLVQNLTPSIPCWLVSPKAERFQPPKLW